LDRLNRQLTATRSAALSSAAAVPAQPAAPAAPAAAPTAGGSRSWVDVLSLVIALLAIGTASLTYLDQNDATTLNERRFAMRYATRVVWWLHGTRGQESGMRIQNRSPAPLHTPVLTVAYPDQGDEGLPAAMVMPGAAVVATDPSSPGRQTFITVALPVDDLPPCSIGHLQVPLLPGVSAMDMNVKAVDFRDGDGRWWSRDASGRLRDMDVLHQQAKDTYQSRWASAAEREQATGLVQHGDLILDLMDRTPLTTLVLHDSVQDAEDCSDA
jgi:hypothetical protein